MKRQQLSEHPIILTSAILQHFSQVNPTNTNVGHSLTPVAHAQRDHVLPLLLALLLHLGVQIRHDACDGDDGDIEWVGKRLVLLGAIVGVG